MIDIRATKNQSPLKSDRPEKSLHSKLTARADGTQAPAPGSRNQFSTLFRPVRLLTLLELAMSLGHRVGLPLPLADAGRWEDGGIVG